MKFEMFILTSRMVGACRGRGLVHFIFIMRPLDIGVNHRHYSFHFVN